MRHLTLNYVRELVRKTTKLDPKRRPVPMPGRKTPTRVAWELTVVVDPKVKYQPSPDGIHPGKALWTGTHKHLSYIGKPSRYRAMQLYKLMRQPGNRIVSFWAAELDRKGLIASTESHGEKPGPINLVTNTYYAYHPHSSGTTLDIVGAFLRPLYIKRVGGMYTYSLQSKLSQEKIDAYYTWYEKTFGKRLRRPRTPAMTIVGGEIQE